MEQEQRAGCLGGWLVRLLGNTSQDATQAALPKMYVSKKFVTPAEANFYRVLQQVVGKGGVILMQVSLNQLLYLPRSKDNASLRTTWQNRIARKSLDFLILDANTLQPRVAIELDDATHAQPNRQTRDDHVEAALRAAGLPLLHCLPSRSYSTEELRQALAPHLSQ